MLAVFENDIKLYHFVSILSRYITGPGEGPMAPGLFVLWYWGSNREQLCAQDGTKQNLLSSAELFQPGLLYYSPTLIISPRLAKSPSHLFRRFHSISHLLRIFLEDPITQTPRIHLQWSATTEPSAAMADPTHCHHSSTSPAQRFHNSISHGPGCLH